MNEELARTFAVSPDIRYVALYRAGVLASAVRPGLENASADVSDRYEELLVNPTLLTLARQRGNIDCGGLVFLVVRYGNFFQLILPLEAGHLSVCIDQKGDPISLATRLRQDFA